MKTIVTENIEIARALLIQGDVVAVPTETVYGLAGDGTNEIAIQKIFDAKQRPNANPLILHFSSQEATQNYITEFPEALSSLCAVFWPGPLTVLLPKSNLVSPLITAGHDRVAIRVPAHPVLQALLMDLPFPLAAPSANRYGSISPTTSQHVLHELDGKIECILEGGPCAYGLESTIIGAENGQVVVYRLGGITLEELTLHLGYIPPIKNKEVQTVTSGMVKHHYAPETPLSFYHPESPIDANAAYIFYKEVPEKFNSSTVVILSEQGDLKEAARKLYSTLHALDSQGYAQLFIEKFPDLELGNTINDRLDRATAK